MAKIVVLAGALMTAVALAGCGEDQYKELPVPGPDPGAQVHAKQWMPPKPPLGSVSAPDIDLTPALGSGGQVGYDYSVGHDRDVKAGLYWKLRSLKEGLEVGNVPADMDSRLKDTRRKIEASLNDAEKPTLRHALAQIDAAYTAYKSQQALRRDGIDTDSLSWDAAVMEGAPQKGLMDDMSYERLRAQRNRMMAYQAVYRGSPEQVKRDALSRAGTELADLGDTLDRQRAAEGMSPLGRAHNPDRSGF